MTAAAVIWNATAGQKRRGPLAPTGREEIERVLSEAGVEAQIIPTESEDLAKQAVKQAVGAGASLIVAAGGDGTAGLVARELIGRDVALGILPLGSVMNIARMLGVPRDLAGAARVLAEGRQALIDVGEARDQVFFEDVSVGIQAAVFRHADEWERGDKSSIVRAIRAAFRYRPRRLEITLDGGRSVSTRALMVVVSNAPYAGLGMTIAPDARLDDGKFDVVVWEHFSKTELFRHLAEISFGRRSYTPHTSTYRSESVAVSGHSPLPVRADAVDLGMTPLECRIRTKCLHVIVGPAFANGRVDPNYDAKGAAASRDAAGAKDKEKAAAALAAAALTSE